MVPQSDELEAVAMFHSVNPAQLGSEEHYEYEQLLRRVRSFIKVKAIVNGAVCLLFLVSFPPTLRPVMALIALIDGLLLGPYWLLVRRYPVLATITSLAFTAMAISAGDWVSGYQTGASGIMYALLVTVANLILIQPLSTYLAGAVISVIYMGTIILEVLGVIPITFPHTISNLTRVVTLNVICFYGLAAMSNVVTRLYREMLYNRTHAEEIAERRTVELRESHAELERTTARLTALQHLSEALRRARGLEATLRTVVEEMDRSGFSSVIIDLVDKESHNLVTRAVSDRLYERVQRLLKVPLIGLAVSLEETANITVRVANSGEVESTDDIRELIVGVKPAVDPALAQAAMRLGGVESATVFPLWAEEEAVGVVSVYHPQGKLSLEDVNLMQAIADQVGLAIENARLFAETISERAKLSAVITGTEDAIMVTDETDHILLLNPAARRAFEIVEENWVGQPLAEVVENQALHDLFARLSVKGTTQNAEIPVDTRTFYANLAPISGVGKVLAMQDITYLKELGEMKSDFVATVSHDLRSPLSAIEGYTDLLKEVGPLNAQQSQFVGRVKAATANMTQLIADLLDLGKIEAGLEMEMTPCDLEYIIDLIVTSLQGWAERKGIELRVELPENVPTVRGNSTRLCQVLTNLVDNALKYTPEGGTVTVELGVENSLVTVSVKDTGIGIGPDDLHNIFDKFYRVETEETRDIAGTGLGLAIAKSVVEMHSGRIWAESEPGVGSTFRFTLPVLEGG
jgi:signal transduction histidine kinase